MFFPPGNHSPDIYTGRNLFGVDDLQQTRFVSFTEPPNSAKVIRPHSNTAYKQQQTGAKMSLRPEGNYKTTSAFLSIFLFLQSLNREAKLICLTGPVSWKLNGSLLLASTQEELPLWCCSSTLWKSEVLC